MADKSKSKKNSKKSSSPKSKPKSAPKQKTEQELQQELQKILKYANLAMALTGAGVATASVKAIYNRLHTVPKKNLSEEEYVEYEKLYSKLSILQKAKMYTLGKFDDCKDDDKDCIRFRDLYNKANRLEDYNKNFRYYNPVSWF